MKALIIGSAKIENGSLIKKNFSDSDLIICADGGATSLHKYELVPDIILGDLDSITNESREYFMKKNVEFKLFPKKKDKTDMEIAIDYALELKATEIVILGATGSRVDHSIANVFLLFNLMNKAVEAKIIDDKNEIHMVNDKIIITKEKGTYISIIPVITTNAVITTKGFEYEVDNYSFNVGDTLGVSNEIKDECGTIFVNEGICLVIKSKD